MESNRLRKFAEAIGGKFRGQVPKGADPAGLAAVYQSSRIGTLPILTPAPENLVDVEPNAEEAIGSRANQGRDLNPGRVDPSFTGHPAL